MKVVTRTEYIAFDDKKFDSAEACKEYEGKSVIGALVGLTSEQLQAALDRTDTTLGEAIERVGNMIAAKRLKDGDRKRGKGQRKSPVAPPPPPPPAGQTPPAPGGDA